MDLLNQLRVLQGKQLALQEGISMLQQTQHELTRNRSSMAAWGLTAIMANTALIPLNIVVNAFDLKAASTALEVVTRLAYDRFARSGTRLDGVSKHALGLLKKAIVDELKRKGLASYVPGASIVVGLAEDSIALLQAAITVESGSREAEALAASIDRRLREAVHRLHRVGIEHADLISRVEKLSRTA